MKKMMILAAAAILSVFAAQAQTTEAFPSYVQVTGQAELEIEPNEIYVSITIDESASKTKITVAEQERKMIAALKKLGLDTDKNLQVGDMSGDLKSYVIRKDKVQTSKSYVLKVGSADMLAKVFSSLADINITNMDISKVTRNDLPELKMRLRTEAMKAAKNNADALASAVGQKVGKAFQITDYNSFGGGEVMYDQAMYKSRTANVMMAEGATTDDSLSFKNLKLSYSVNARFVLE